MAAVGETGALGTLACTWTPPGELARVVASVRELSARPFAANLVLSFEPEAQLDALLAAGIPVLTFSWGQPGRERIARCHDAGARVAVQVGSAAGARQAVADGADVLIAQGIEAGGHVQSTTPLDELVALVVDVAGTTPVIATGGLTVRQDLTRAHARGAAGTMLGTRFVATAESAAHPEYKAALVAAERLAAGPGLAGDVLVACVIDEEWASIGAEALVGRHRADAAVLPERMRRPAKRMPIAYTNAPFARWMIRFTHLNASGLMPNEATLRPNESMLSGRRKSSPAEASSAAWKPRSSS